MSDEVKLKTVAVLGGSYGGNRAAQVLAAGLPSGWRVVLIDRNSHFNHVYNLPRYSVLPGHEHKAFIPYDNLFGDPSGPTASHPHKRVYGTVTALHPHHVTYTPHASSGGSSPVETEKEEVLCFDYAIYALGSHLPSPIDLWGSREFESSLIVDELGLDVEMGRRRADSVRPYGGTKQEGIYWLRSSQQRIEAARRVLVVGGGALGIQFASDIAAIYPCKSVTLLHSRSGLLPRFDEALGGEVLQSLQGLGVHVIFDERLDMSSVNGDGTNKLGDQEAMSVKTTKGRQIETDLVLLCTGQTPNTSLLRTMDPRTINPKNGMVRVSRTMQIIALEEEDINESALDGRIRLTSPTLCGTTAPSPVETLIEMDSAPPAPVLPSASTNDVSAKSETDASCHSYTSVYPHFFAIGDATDAFGAINAGHTAHYQGEVAARNVLKLIDGATKLGGESRDAEGGPELEAYVPCLPMIKVTIGLTKSAYQVAGAVGAKDDATEDLGAAIVWGAYGYRDVDREGMWA